MIKIHSDIGLSVQLRLSINKAKHCWGFTLVGHQHLKCRPVHTHQSKIAPHQPHIPKWPTTARPWRAFGARGKPSPASSIASFWLGLWRMFFWGKILVLTEIKWIQFGCWRMAVSSEIFRNRFVVIFLAKMRLFVLQEINSQSHPSVGLLFERVWSKDQNMYIMYGTGGYVRHVPEFILWVCPQLMSLFSNSHWWCL